MRKLPVKRREKKRTTQKKLEKILVFKGPEGTFFKKISIREPIYFSLRF
jgi:hypothetical protein